MTIHPFRVDQIRVPEGRRPVDHDFVKRLAESIRQQGLLHPIGVKPDGTLIWGNHRLEAHKLLGEATIPCVVRDAAAVDAELMELEENLENLVLTREERIAATTRQKELYEAKYPETKHVAGLGTEVGRGRENRSVQNGHSYDRPEPFRVAAGKKTGRSEGAVARDVRIGQAFNEEQVHRLCEAGVPTDTMDALASVKKSKPEVVAAVLAQPESALRAAVDEAIQTHKPKRTSTPPKAEPDGEKPEEENTLPTHVPHPNPKEARRLRTASVNITHNLEMSAITVVRFYSQSELLIFIEWLKKKARIS